MDKGIFTDREQAAEAAYFRQHDARLVERLRQGAKIDELAAALAEKLDVDNPDLLQKARLLGLTGETGPALLLAPLVQVAWIDGTVSESERETVLRIAAERGMESESPAHNQLVDWLRVRPSDAVFDTAVEVIKCGLDVLPPEEKNERITRIVHACQEVATASGGGLLKALGLGSGVSDLEASLLDTITRTLRSGS
jgi:uncharacterized tellurite resistance protein B-like protein